MKSLVLLGGGHAHLEVLRAFAAAPPAAMRLTLVSPFPALVYSAMVPGVLAGHYRLDDCLIPLRPLAAAAKAEFIEAAATGIDAAARSVALSNGTTLRYDVLGIDTGATLARDAIAGARQHALCVRPIEPFMHLWARVLALAAESSLGVVVVGGGAGGVELALAIQHALGERARVSLVTGGGAPLAQHPAALRDKVRCALQRRRITVFEQACVAVHARQVELDGGLRLACDAPLLATGASAPAWLRGSGLALDAAGFVATGPTLQSLSHPDVFAAGDVAARPDAPRPKNGVYAVRAGPPLALNLRRFIAGGELRPYTPQRRSLALLACGERRAIAAWGRWAVEGDWVWRWKDRIDRAFVATYRGPRR